jgi:hypothetical protein
VAPFSGGRVWFLGGSAETIVRRRRDVSQARNPSLTAFIAHFHIIVSRWSGRDFCVVNGESFCAFKHKVFYIIALMYLIISSNAGRVARSGRRGLGSGQ